MKRSLIITAFLCLALGESFSIINKKEEARQKAAAYCSIKSGQQSEAKSLKANAGPYMPIVNILGYN